MSYSVAVERMYALGHELAQTPSHKFDLKYMRVLLGALGNPEERLRSVLIAGTNGKGSTAATLAAIIRASGVRTGLYTSPHLVRINERIRIDGHEIEDDQFALIHDLVDRTAERLVEEGELPWHPSFFEMLTAMAFEYFARQKVELAVLEVGMGGRLDATNVVEPLVSVITDISLDHQKFLGETISEIAGEKAGIIRREGIVVTLPQSPAANDVIGNTIMEKNARAVSAVPYVPPVSPASEPHFGKAKESKAFTTGDTEVTGGTEAAAGTEVTGQVESAEAPTSFVSRYPLQVMGREITVETPLVGRHQLRNVALAIATAEELSKQGFPISAESIESGIRQTRWPGRFEVLSTTGGARAVPVVLDVAHNPAGAWALRSTLSAMYEDRRLVFVFGAMRDKALSEIAEILFPLAERVILTRAENPRSATTQELREAATRTSVEMEDGADVGAAIHCARELAGSNGIVVVTGSIYIVGEAMRHLQHRI